jgi:hypothetical protein
LFIDNGLPLIEYFESITEWSWKVDKKYQKILRMIGTDDPNALSIVPIDWRMEERYDKILAEFVKNKEMNIKQIHDNILAADPRTKALSDREDSASYRKVERIINKLSSLNMLEVSKEGQIDNLHKTFKYYRLSLNGLFYVILNWMNFLRANVLNNLFAKHSNNILFKMFLLPFFEEKTLISASNCSGNFLIVEIINYLVEICKVILVGRRAKFGFSQGDDDYSNNTLSHTLFFWPPSYPDRKDKFDHWYKKDGTLRSYLERELGWNWINDASIVPDYGSDRIYIKHNHHPDNPYITINRHENNAVLVKGADRFRFKLEKGKTGLYHVTVKTRRMYKPPKERIDEGIKHSSKVKLLELIFIIKDEWESLGPAVRQILNNDKRFKETINNFIKVLWMNEN